MKTKIGPIYSAKVINLLVCWYQRNYVCTLKSWLIISNETFPSILRQFWLKDKVIGELRAIEKTLNSRNLKMVAALLFRYSLSVCLACLKGLLGRSYFDTERWCSFCQYGAGTHWRLFGAVMLKMNTTRKLQERNPNNSGPLDLRFKRWNFGSREGCGNSALCSADLEFQVQCFGV